MKHHEKGPGHPEDIKISTETRFRVTEAYKLARTNIMFSVLKEGCKKMVISSSLSGEGKTTTSVHIAVALAQMDVKVLLIDADLRKPRVNQYFYLKNIPGLTNCLGGLTELDQAVHKTAFKNLSVLCAGVSVPNPSEMLASDKMSSFLKELESQFDYIILDTPPLNVVADALPLIKLSDGVILVIREGSSTYPELNKTIKTLELLDAKILGFILNDVDSKKQGSYRYGYGRSYRSYGNYGA